MMTEVSLPDMVVALQRMDLPSDARRAVDEAARILPEGREMEARALVEKAEALVGQNRLPARKVNGNGAVAAAPTNAVVVPIAEKIAAGFTAVLTTALEDVHRNTGEQIQVVARLLEDRIRGLDTTIGRTSARLDVRLEQIASEQRDLRQAQTSTASALNSLQQAGLDTRVKGLEERVTSLDQMVRDLQPQIGGALEKLDRHTESLRALERRHAQRVSTLNDVLDNLAKLREPEPTVESNLPGPM